MKGSPEYRFSKDELDWLAEHVDSAVSWARGDSTIRWVLVVTFFLGFIAYLVGFALAAGDMSLPAGWPTDFVGDLLVHLGVALWTSVAIALFLQVIPDWQRRQTKRYARAALEALRGRGVDVPPVVEGADTGGVEARLDAILARLSAIEQGLREGAGSAE